MNIEDLKCCGNCGNFEGEIETTIITRQCECNSSKVCENWTWDILTAQERK